MATSVPPSAELGPLDCEWRQYHQGSQSYHLSLTGIARTSLPVIHASPFYVMEHMSDRAVVFIALSVLSVGLISLAFYLP